MKIAPFAAIVSLMAAASSYGASIFAGSLRGADGGATDLVITNSQGSLLTSGYAGTGTFSITDSEVTNLVNQGNFATLFQSFTPFAVDNFKVGDPNVGANFYYGYDAPGSYTATSEVDPTNYIGKTVYTFLSTSSTGASDGAQYGLLSYTTKLTADPAAPNPENTYSFYGTDGTLLFGKAGTASSTGFADGGTHTVGSIGLQSVPEASTALLGLLGVVGLVRRRR